MANVLIAEDDVHCARLIVRAVKRMGLEAVWVTVGDQAITYLQHDSFDLMVADTWTQHRQNVDLLAERKRLAPDMPVLAIIELDADYSPAYAVRGDASISKPFRVSQLMSHIRKLLPGSIRLKIDDTPAIATVSGHTSRRATAHEEHGERIRFGRCEIDVSWQRVTCNGIPVHLTPTEFRILLALGRRQGQIVTRKEIVQGILGYDGVRKTRTVDSHIASIRRKLGEERRHLRTAHGLGYRLDVSHKNLERHV